MCNRQVKILLIEDERVIVELVKLTFSLPQYDILVAQNMLDGIQHARESRPDLILVDIRLPRESKESGLIDPQGGIQVCQELKKDVRTRNIPIVILTAVPGTEMKSQIEEIGVQNCIYKPFNESDLFQIVDSNIIL